MWEIVGSELYEFRTPGGDRFTSLVDETIRIHASAHGVDLGRVTTNLRTNKPDGGVDSEVAVSVPNDETGWMTVPTCWQYKAKQSGEISTRELIDEIQKPYARGLIAKGYGYRLCVCDDFPPQKVSEWEALLTAEAKAISVTAAAPKVINASHLASWISRYRGLVLRRFKPYLGPFKDIQAWGSSATALTRVYVPIGEWGAVQTALLTHLNFDVQSSTPLLTIQAQPGIGKSRFAYETILSLPTIHGIALYTDDARAAVLIAPSLVTAQAEKAVLIVDECGVEARVRLEEILRGSSERIRVVAIDNSLERPSSGEAEYQLSKMPTDSLLAILAQNFPSVSESNRRAYVESSDGYVRLASDLCRNDAAIVASGNIVRGAGGLGAYLKTRLRENEQYVNALSLVTKMGCAGAVKNQLSDLAAATRLDPNSFENGLTKVKDVTGFVVRTPDYFYVTPEVVAQICFDRGWKQWVAPNIQEFVDQLKDELLESFQKRVARSGAPEVRREVGNFFRRWLEDFGPENLLSKEGVTRLEVLVNTDPDVYLPKLCQLIVESPLKFLPGKESSNPASQDIRRQLVWLLERLVGFKEYFSMVEPALRILALEESEPHISNNATSIWRQLFRIVLSGTSVSFDVRLQLLVRLIQNANETTSDLALSALDGIFAEHGTRVVGPSVVAGRIVPQQWLPKNHGDWENYQKLAFDELVKLAKSESSRIRKSAIDSVVRHTRTFLARGYLNDLQMVLTNSRAIESVLPRLLESIDHYLAYDAPKQTNGSNDYPDAVRRWAKSLVPETMHGQVVSLVGRKAWHYVDARDKDDWEKQLSQLAHRLATSLQALQEELWWLNSAAARSAGVLGQKIGEVDSDAKVFDLIFESARASGFTTLAQGYALGLIEAHPEYMTRLLGWIDKTFPEAPQIARDILFAVATKAPFMERMLSSVDRGWLSIDTFLVLSFGRLAESARPADYCEILKRLLEAQDRSKALAIAIDILGYRLWYERQESLDSVLDSGQVVAQIWNVVENGIEDKEVDSYKLFEILEVLSTREPEKAIEIAGFGLISESFSTQERAEEFLKSMATKHPELVMVAIGTSAMDPKRGWMFRVLKFGDIFRELPTTVVIDWLNKVGVEGARQIARHIPMPFLTENGEPALHPTTEYVLRSFEDDDEVFREYCAGTHSMQLYSGDIAAGYDQEAAVARKFLDSSLPRVREWARMEMARAVADAAAMRKDEQERWLE
jgi:hypothetical protein